MSKPHIATGTYTGNDVDNRQITGLEFNPRYIHIFCATETHFYTKMDTMAGFWATWTVIGGTTLFMDLLIKIIPDGFEINNNHAISRPNRNGKNYHWTAWG